MSNGKRGQNPEFVAQKGRGRPKGSVDKKVHCIREMIKAALERAGGAEYLYQQSLENPVAFMGLIGKVIPREVDATITGSVNINWPLPKSKLDG